MADGLLLFDAVKITLEKYGNRIVTGLRERLLSEGKTATFDLYNSIQFAVITEGDTISLNIHANEYLQWVSDGVRPGGSKQPPPENIKKWISVKGIRPRSYKLPSGKTRTPNIDQLSFLIGRSIKIKGIRPTHIIEQTFENAQGDILTDLSQTIAQALTRQIGQDMQEIADKAAQDFVNNNIQIQIQFT